MDSTAVPTSSTPRFPALIETPRLILRRYLPADVPILLALVQQDRAHLVREFKHQSSMDSEEAMKTFIGEKQEQWNASQTFCYGIWQKQDGQLIGQVQVKNIAWDIPSAELGYFIRTDSQRNGYAIESIRGVVQIALRDFNFERIFVRILAANTASLSLALKLGFLEEGLHRSAFRCGLGELHDVHVLAITRADYSAYEHH